MPKTTGNSKAPTLSASLSRFLSSSTMLSARILSSAVIISAPIAASAIGTATHDSGTTITQTTAGGGTTTTVTNLTDSKTINNWTNLDTGSKDVLNILQKDRYSISLNRDQSGHRTNFDGQLNSNGKVWIINPNGMLFGPDSSIKVSSLLLSTADISDNNFRNPTINTDGTTQYEFNKAAHDQKNAVITMMGTNIDTTNNPFNTDPTGNNIPSQNPIPGDVIIQAPGIALLNQQSNGVDINTQGGKVMLAAGQTFSVDFNGDGLVNFASSKIDKEVTQKVNVPTDSTWVVKDKNGNLVAATSTTSGAFQLGQSNIYVGPNTHINQNDYVGNSARVLFTAKISEDAVMDHVINLGGVYENFDNYVQGVGVAPSDGGSTYMNDPEKARIVPFDLEGDSTKIVIIPHPTCAPTHAPTPAPTSAPTPAPTSAPTPAPTSAPTPAPTSAPTPAPTSAPTPAPTSAPTPAPTSAPTPAPTSAPTPAPTSAPTPAPTSAPTPAPTSAPTPAPTSAPTPAPTSAPTPAPTSAPTPAPTSAPTPAPTSAPTPAPTSAPTPAPTSAPTPAPTSAPTPAPTSAPAPTPAPTSAPTPAPTSAPTPAPTSAPTPTAAPAAAPAPVSFNESETNPVIDPLTRPVISVGDESTKAATVNPGTANETYERPYLVSMGTSVADGKLTLLATGGQNGGSITNLGTLSPAAGGNAPASGTGDLAGLSPSAGGSSSGGSLNCANAFLDNDWNKTPDQRTCAEDRNINHNTTPATRN